MVQTSFKSYVIAGLTSGLIISVVVLAFFSLDPTIYDISGFDNSTFSEYGAYDEIQENINETSVNVLEETNADTTLFDVLGGLVATALTQVKNLFSGIGFLMDSVSNLFGGLSFTNAIFNEYVIGVIMISLTTVILFRVFIKAEDEK